MRLVEQPQLGPAGDQARERGAPPLAGRQLANRHGRRGAGRAQPLHRGVDLIGRRADGGAPEPDVLGDGEIGVEPVGVAEQADPAAAPPARRVGEVETRAHVAVPRTSGSSPAQSRSSVVLPAPFGPLQQHDLAASHGQRRAGQHREAAEHGDRVVELDTTGFRRP